jgi:hypothetical protein
MADKMHTITLRLLWITRTHSNGGPKTPSKFGIFKRLRSGPSILIVGVEVLEEARNRISRLAIVRPGDYLIYSEEKGLVVERVIR